MLVHVSIIKLMQQILFCNPFFRYGYIIILVVERIYLKPRFGFPYPKVLTMKKWVEIKLLNKVVVQWNFEKSSKMAKTVGWKLDFAAYPLLQSNSICLLSFSTYSVMHIAAFTLDNFWMKNMKPISNYIPKLRYLYIH